MKNITLLFSALVLISSGLLCAQDAKIYPWTDLQGRTLQATFIKLDESSVTINWNGQNIPIPLNSLSEESRNLAKKLAAEAAFASVKPAGQLYPWTDL